MQILFCITSKVVKEEQDGKRKKFTFVFRNTHAFELPNTSLIAVCISNESNLVMNLTVWHKPANPVWHVNYHLVWYHPVSVMAVILYALQECSMSMSPMLGPLTMVWRVVLLCFLCQKLAFCGQFCRKRLKLATYFYLIILL